jgi:hypothetical protein
MYYALEYWFEVRKAPIDKANQGIGIIPYIYDQAKEYYQSINRANSLNSDIFNYRAKITEITIAPPKPEERQPRIFNIEEVD